MKFVVDCHIPFIEGVLEPYGEVRRLTPAEITPAAVRDADALLVRTRTRIDRDLLEGSRCRFVATATIGMDHFDAAWCRKAGVTAVNAPGCNAPAVAQYVLACIAALSRRPVAGSTLAVVGVGNVGRIVARWAESAGMEVLPVDPPRQLAEGGDRWLNIADAASRADIITFHTPLTAPGTPFATRHLADEAFFASLDRKPVIVNAARGAVVDNAAWLAAIRAGRLTASAIDVWEGEPLVDRELMHAADISTPHIAGYSEDGKIRATQMVLDALSRHFGLPRLEARTRRPVDIPLTVTLAAAAASYDPMADTAYMRDAIDAARTDDEVRRTFERLRDTYPLRNEINRPIP